MSGARIILAMLMLSIFMVRDLSRPIIAADYLVNLEKYRAACINKSIPKSGCNGRCQMMRRMAGTEKPLNSETTPPLKPFLGESSYQQPSKPGEIDQFSIVLVHDPIAPFSDYAYHFTADIFHPPAHS